YDSYVGFFRTLTPVLFLALERFALPLGSGGTVARSDSRRHIAAAPCPCALWKRSPMDFATRTYKTIPGEINRLFFLAYHLSRSRP
ncbi:hypothetical protein F5141DRAFT_1105793, partial [Pisolithus sp. B1]